MPADAFQAGIRIENSHQRLAASQNGRLILRFGHRHLVGRNGCISGDSPDTAGDSLGSHLSWIGRQAAYAKQSLPVEDDVSGRLFRCCFGSARRVPGGLLGAVLVGVFVLVFVGVLVAVAGCASVGGSVEVGGGG